MAIVNKQTETLTKAGGILVTFIVAFLILGIIGLVGHPFRKAPADKIAISYGGGLFEGAQYQGITNPGSGLKFNGFYDHWYEYPATQRNYIVSNEKDEGDKEKADTITAPDKNGVTEKVELTVTFKLNTAKLRQFHEQVGLKYKAWTADGWKKMLADNFRQPLNNAVQQKLRQYTTDEIRSGKTVLEDVQNAVEESLKADIVVLLGDEYFCGPSYKLNDTECPNFQVTIKAITPPADIVQSYADQKTSENKVKVATNNAQAQIEKAKGEQASKDAVAPALTNEYLAYLRVQALQTCAANPSCTLVVGGNEFNINVK